MKRALIASILVLTAGPALAAGTASSPSWFNIIMLVVVMGLLMLGAWAAKKYGPVAGVKKALGVEVLGRVPLSQKSGLALVRAGSQVMVLGLTSDKITLLKELPLSEFNAEINPADQAGES